MGLILCCIEDRNAEKQHNYKNRKLEDYQGFSSECSTADQYMNGIISLMKDQQNQIVCESCGNINGRGQSAKYQFENKKKSQYSFETQFYSIPEIPSFQNLTDDEDTQGEQNDKSFDIQSQNMLYKIEEVRDSTEKNTTASESGEVKEEELEEQDQEKMEELIRALEGESSEELGWKQTFNDDESQTFIYKKMDKEKDAILIKAESLIPNSNIANVFDQFYNIEKRCKWDSMLVEIKQLEQLNQNTDIIYFRINAGFAVSDREWIIKRIAKQKYKENSNEVTRIWLTSYSVDSNLQTQKKGVIRAQCHIQGYYLEQRKDHVYMQIISCMDIKGSVPKIIVNKFADKGTKDWIAALKKQNLRVQQSQK